MSSATDARTPTFFATPAAFRRWLQRRHATAQELWIGFYKVTSGKGGMVYRQALDEALCFGWIDGMLRRVDEECYVQRFTPRKPGSRWSLVNIRKAKALIERGLMTPAGLAAFERRDERKSAAHSLERERVRLVPPFAARLKANAAAHAFFLAQAPGYRRMASWWVMSAKKEETRARRFAVLLEDCAAGRRLAVMLPDRRSRERAGQE